MKTWRKVYGCSDSRSPAVVEAFVEALKAPVPFQSETTSVAV